MAKNNKSNNNKIQSSKDEMISEQELYDVLEFARNAYAGNYPSIFTPQMVNERLKDLNLNPLQADKDNIDKALKSPKQSERQLVGYSEFFELTNMIYKRMLSYMAHLLSFSIKDIICINAEEKDYTSPKYMNDYKAVCNFLDKFDIKQEFSKVMRELIRQDASFWVLRDDGQKYVLQELPEEYCLITGRWDYGILFDFNMVWFLQPGVSIDMYPDIFKEMYRNTFFDNDGTYNPASVMGARDNSYTLWTQTSPLDNFWAWKLTPELATRIPFLAPMFQDVVLQPLVRNLQMNKYIVEATKVMVGLIPMIKDPKGASVKDMVALDAETAGKFLALLKQGIGDTIKTGAVPFTDVKTLDFESTHDTNILEQYAKTTTSMSGINTRLIYSSDKQNNLETELSLDVDIMTIGYMYSYFENFLEYMINQRTKNFHFKINLGGVNTTSDKKHRREEFIELSSIGVVLPDRLAYALDMLPHHLQKQMEKAKATKFNEKLLPMLNLYTDTTGNSDSGNSTANKKKNGRPQKDTSELSESGEKSREYD